MSGAMKWWGWGEDGVAFSDADKPALAPFIKTNLGLDVRRSTARPVAFGDLAIPDPVVPPVLQAALEEAVGAAHVSADPLDRVVHGRGKSLRDLVLQRRGDLGRLPDAVLRPGTEDEVAAVLAAALDADAVVIPFGAAPTSRAASLRRRANRGPCSRSTSAGSTGCCRSMRSHGSRGCRRAPSGRRWRRS